MSKYSHIGGVYVMGDIHGRWEYILDVAPKLHHVGGTILIQCGDFGLGFYSEEKERERLAIINETLEKYAIELWILRGNHDKPSCFTGKYMFSNIRTIKDYTVEHLGQRNFLFVGGAISIDRVNRLVGQTYWPDETVTVWNNNELNNLLNKQKIHSVITHTGPPCGPPVVREKSQLVQLASIQDSHLIEDVKKENEYMQTLWNKIINQGACKDWYYGHFHDHGSVDMNGTILHLLDIEEVLPANIKN